MDPKEQQAQKYHHKASANTKSTNRQEALLGSKKQEAASFEMVTQGMNRTSIAHRSARFISL